MKRASPVLLVTLAFFGLLLAWSVALPSLQAPDEVQHVDAAYDLREGRGWGPPHQRNDLEVAADLGVRLAGPTDNQMTQHPPGYYALVAPLAARPADAGRVHLMRLVTVLLLLPLPALAWATARRLGAPGETGALAVLAVPQLAQVGVNNDALLVPLGGVVTWLAVRARTGDGSWATAVGAGAALAGALFAKGLALALVPVVVAGWWGRWRRLAVVLGVAVLGGWWWAANLLRYGVVQPAGYDQPVVGEPWSLPRYARFFVRAMAERFWGWFGPLEFGLPLWLVALASVVSVVALALGVRAARGRAVLALLPAAGLLAVVGWGALRSHQTTGGTPGVQGRYLFAGLVGIAAVAAVGLRRVPPLAVLAAAAGMQAAGLVVLVRHYGGVRPGAPGLLYPVGLAVAVAATGLLAVRLATARDG